MTFILNRVNVQNFVVLRSGSLKDYNFTSVSPQKCETEHLNNQVLLKIRRNCLITGKIFNFNLNNVATYIFCLERSEL
jgi:hypothetical protein